MLLADEPTGELDSNTGLEIMLLFRHIVAEEGVTAVVAHDPALSQIADWSCATGMPKPRAAGLRPAGPGQHVEIVDSMAEGGFASS